MCSFKRSCEMLGFAFLLVLNLHSPALDVAAFSPVVTGRTTKRTLVLSVAIPSTNTCDPTEGKNDDFLSSSRRSILMQTIATACGAMTTTLMPLPNVCNAASKSNIDPDTAYINLRKAREELVTAGRTYFPKRDWDGLREFLDNEDSYINNYDTNASALLTSKRLDAESKQAIGTIRRYGVGADVIIMYGGLKAELAEDNERPNPAEIEKYYIKTLDSLEEVIAIVRSNPGFRKIE